MNTIRIEQVLQNTAKWGRIGGKLKIKLDRDKNEENLDPTKKQETISTGLSPQQKTFGKKAEERSEKRKRLKIEGHTEKRAAGISLEVKLLSKKI